MRAQPTTHDCAFNILSFDIVHQSVQINTPIIILVSLMITRKVIIQISPYVMLAVLTRQCQVQQQQVLQIILYIK